MAPGPVLNAEGVGLFLPEPLPTLPRNVQKSPLSKPGGMSLGEAMDPGQAVEHPRSSAWLVPDLSS